MFLITLIVVLFFGSFVVAQNDETCQLPGGEKGKCILIDNCPYALNLLKKRIFPRICGFQGKTPVVCCKDEKKQPLYFKPGELSIAKCKEYYPGTELDTDEVLVPGGRPSLVKEFPHMAIIGFGEENSTQWQCGGSLISEYFVLTAAHCLYSAELGPAKFVRLGDLDLATDTDEAQPQNFIIKRRIPHPEYKIPSRYNDIALVELDRKIQRTGYVAMACLDTLKQHSEQSMIATGWGRTEYIGEASSILLKTNLDIINHDTCKEFYKTTPKKQLLNGIDNDVQICAGGKPEQDTCQGDSGGPLQIIVRNRNNRFRNYNIVGVTSFGKACGISRAPGVYTRVSNYLGWIESVVWPSQ